MTKVKQKLPFFLFISVLCVCVATSVFLRISSSGENSFTVIVDAGHGGEDGGAVSISGKCEKDFNLDTSLRLSEALENMGYKTVLTRSSDCDTDGKEGFHKREDILSRLDFTEKYPNSIFVSVHMNSSGSETDKGFQVFFGTKNEKSKLLAQSIYSAVAEKAYVSRLREVKKTPDSVYIMKNSKVPSVLVECGFISNKTDEELLSDADYRKDLAYVLALGIDGFIKSEGLFP